MIEPLTRWIPMNRIAEKTMSCVNEIEKILHTDKSKYRIEGEWQQKQQQQKSKLYAKIERKRETNKETITKSVGAKQKKSNRSPLQRAHETNQIQRHQHRKQQQCG